MANVIRYFVTSNNGCFLYSENLTLWNQQIRSKQIKGFYYSLLELNMSGWLNRNETENAKQWEI